MLQPTELIDEVYLRLIDQSQPAQWENRPHFFAIAARLMRNVLVDYARARRAAKRGGEAGHVTLEETASIVTRMWGRLQPAAGFSPPHFEALDHGYSSAIRISPASTGF